MQQLQIDPQKLVDAVDLRRRKGDEIRRAVGMFGGQVAQDFAARTQTVEAGLVVGVQRVIKLVKTAREAGGDFCVFGSAGLGVDAALKARVCSERGQQREFERGDGGESGVGVRRD